VVRLDGLLLVTTYFGVVQDGLPPHTMRCLRCGDTWQPKPVGQGKTKGQHTDDSLDKQALKHLASCEPE